MTKPTCVIIGGGFSGSLTALHLARRATGARIVIVEPRPELGLGLAYSTPTLRHLLNVPAGKISAFPDQPGHFLEWARAHYSPDTSAMDFVPRAIFGKYVQSLISRVRGVEHIRNTAVDCTPQGAGAVVKLADGSQLAADAVILATGNFDPAPLRGVSEEAARRGIYCHSAWETATYQGLDPLAPVALIGTGLTAVDVILRLREAGHRGVITAVSRHGIFPNRHAPYEPLSECIIAGKPPATARELLHALHEAIRSGIPWRAAIDSLRARTNELWLALPLSEQKRFRRHLQRRWDVVRHRMAPLIADQIEAELRAASLVIREGSLLEVSAQENGARVRSLSRSGAVTDFSAARVINCTGPSMNYMRAGSALLSSLFEQGLITPGPLGGGLWSDQAGALRSAEGSYSEVLFNVGPGRQGTLLESIAVPELRSQAVQLADRLAEPLRAASAVARPLSGTWQPARPVLAPARPAGEELA